MVSFYCLESGYWTSTVFILGVQVFVHLGGTDEVYPFVFCCTYSVVLYYKDILVHIRYLVIY